MGRKPKQKRTIRVKCMFEPDRLSSVNLQIAYEQLIPPQQYCIVPMEKRTGKPSEEIPIREEVLV